MSWIYGPLRSINPRLKKSSFSWYVSCNVLEMGILKTACLQMLTNVILSFIALWTQYQLLNYNDLRLDYSSKEAHYKKLIWIQFQIKDFFNLLTLSFHAPRVQRNVHSNSNSTTVTFALTTRLRSEETQWSDAQRALHCLTFLRLLHFSMPMSTVECISPREALSYFCACLFRHWSLKPPSRQGLGWRTRLCTARPFSG